MNYEVAKLTQSGSDAAMAACVDATGGDLSTRVFGQGLYVTGYAMSLRGMYTSDGDTRTGMTAGEGRELCMLLNHW